MNQKEQILNNLTNENKLHQSIDELQSRLRGLVLSGIITEAFADELWKLLITIMRRSYIVGESVGVYALDDMIDYFALTGTAAGKLIKRRYFDHLQSAIPVMEDAPLFSNEEVE